MLHSLFRPPGAFAFFNFFNVSISSSLVISSISSFPFLLSSLSSLSICHTAFSCVSSNNSTKWSFHSSMFIFSLILSVFFFLYLLMYFHASASLFMFRILSSSSSSSSCFFFCSLHHSLYSLLFLTYFSLSILLFSVLSILFLTPFSYPSIPC